MALLASMPVSVRHPWLAAVIALMVHPAAALEPTPPQPIYAFNQHPIAQIHGIPSLGSASPLAARLTEVTFNVTVANHFAGESNGSEFLILDGETHRATLIIRHGFGAGIEGGVELPYVHHSGGFLDGLIENFHDAFGLSQGGRDMVPRDRLLYRYRRDGVERLSLTEAGGGLGDVRLTGAIALNNNSGIPIALRGLVKLPTGDADDLTGSGATDFALWLSAACRKTHETFCVYGGAGAIWLGNGEVIEGQVRNVVPYTSLGLDWRAFPSIDVKIQLDSHGSLYGDSTVRALEEYAVQLLGAVEWRFAPHSALEISFSEDLVVETSSDIVWQLAYRQIFQ
jgi:hypothetical protein